jgi:soluble lytic murein transglycosylase-like protein
MWESHLQEMSQKYGIDPDLARAVMRMESGGNPNAVSSAGAIGLMQLMPGTARGLGVNPQDPKRNIEGGVKYLAQLADKYDGDYERTLAAYNAGSARVDSYDGIPPFPETQRYVKNVLALYRKYSKGD